MIIGEVNACVQAINTVANAVKNGKKDKDKAHAFKTFMWLGSEFFYFMTSKQFSNKKKTILPSKIFNRKNISL